jgi:hypothetical protein
MRALLARQAADAGGCRARQGADDRAWQGERDTGARVGRPEAEVAQTKPAQTLLLAPERQAGGEEKDMTTGARGALARQEAGAETLKQGEAGQAGRGILRIDPAACTACRPSPPGARPAFPSAFGLPGDREGGKARGGGEEEIGGWPERVEDRLWTDTHGSRSMSQ